MATTPRIPPGLSVVDLAAQKGLTPASNAARDALRRQAVKDSLSVANPSSATTGMSLDFDANNSRIDLHVMDIAFYDENPRTNINPLYAEIKESIRESGIRTPLVVTRKPGTKQYFLAAGGNTRLLSIRELWEETQDPRFYTTTCTFVAWKSDSDVLAGHLIENEVRGNMSFWDKAQGRWSLKAKLEAQQGKQLGIRAFEKVLREIGLTTQLSMLSNYGFAVETLQPLGNRLAKENVKQIQPRYNLYKRLAALHHTDEAVFQRDCFEPVQRQYLDLLGDQTAGTKESQVAYEGNEDRGGERDDEGQFDTVGFLNYAEQAVLVYLKIEPSLGAVMLRKIHEFPEIGLGELQQAIHHANERSGSGNNDNARSQNSASRPPEAALLAASLQAAGAPDPAIVAAQRALAQSNQANEQGFGRQGDNRHDNGHENGDENGSYGDHGYGNTAGAQANAPHNTIPSAAQLSPSLTAPMLTPKAPLPLALRLEKAKKELLLAVRELVGHVKFTVEYFEYKGSRFGFYVDFPKQPLSTFENAIDRCSVWWIIASLSGQQEDIGCLLLPENSAWRRSFLQEPPLNTDAAAIDHETRVQYDLGDSGSYLPSQWITASRRPVVQTAVRCLLLHQQAQALLDQYEAEQGEV
jgi:ParB family protein of integrating conjugative element (PFGI_1 class)